MAEPLSLGQLGRVLSRYWILIVIGTVLGGLLAFGVTRILPSVYRATAIQLVKGLPGTGAAANYQSAQFAISRAKTYPPFVYNATVLGAVRTDIDGAQSLAELRDDITVTNPIDTPLLEISAAGSTAQEARDKANSAARHLAQFITDIESVDGKSPILVETAVQAALPTTADSPKVVVITVLGVLIGFALATVIALVHSRVRYQRQLASRRKDALDGVGADPALAPSARTGPAGAAAPLAYPAGGSVPLGAAAGVAPLADPAGGAVPLAAAAGVAPLAAAAGVAPLGAAAGAAPLGDPGGVARVAHSAGGPPLARFADEVDVTARSPAGKSAKDAAQSPNLGSEASWDLARELAHAVTEATQSWSAWDESLFETDPDPTTVAVSRPMTPETVAVNRTEPPGTVQPVDPVDAEKSRDSVESKKSHDDEAADPGGAADRIHGVEVESPNPDASADLPRSIDEITTDNGFEKVSVVQESARR